jgi:hypothetical protein
MDKNMNKILLLFLLAGCTALNAQPALVLHTQAPDTLTSIFGQEEFRIWADPIPADTIDYEVTPHYEMYVNLEHTYISVKFPGRDWVIMRKKPTLKIYYESSKYENIRINDQPKYADFLNLIPFYAEIPGLFEEMKQGGNILVRFQIFARFEQDTVKYPLSMYFTQTDSVYVPPANNQDIQALAYWQSIVKSSMRDFAYLDGMSSFYYSDEQLNHIINNYPESLLSEYAKYAKAMNTFLEWLREERRSVSEQRSKNHEVFHPLYNSKSPLVKLYARKQH